MLCSNAAQSQLESVYFLFIFIRSLSLTLPIVAKVDAVQAEYSAFETLHETDGLIQTAKELGITYVAYSPLGHGWLVDDFPYKSPDDFAPDDFRRNGESFFPLSFTSHGLLNSLIYSA